MSSSRAVVAAWFVSCVTGGVPIGVLAAPRVGVVDKGATAIGVACGVAVFPVAALARQATNANTAVDITSDKEALEVIPDGFPLA